MNFHLPYSKTKNSFQDYLLTFLFLIGAYIIGNIPSLFVFSQNKTDSNDIIEVLQTSVGNTFAFALLLLPWVFVFFAMLFSTKFILSWPINFLFSRRKKIDFVRIIVGFCLWFFISLVIFFINKNDLVINNFNSEAFIPLFLVASFILFFQCAAEEMLFRSFFLKCLGNKVSNPIILILTTGFLFGYMHKNNPEFEAIGQIVMIFYIGTGVFLGLITLLDEGLELSIGFHFANNLFAALIVTNDRQLFQTNAIFLDTNPPNFDWLNFASVFGGQALFFIVCYFYYGWEIRKLKTTKQ